jgi:acyl-coenzyme A thioesterase PaaI-like protein
VIAETCTERLNKIREEIHPHCVVCSFDNIQGLNLEFVMSTQGEVSANFICDKALEGYPGVLHGGILAAILDGAMTNCLFAHDCIAVTADFRVRFRHPVVTSQETKVRAWIIQSTPPLYELKAEIIQDGKVKTTATGKFMDQSPRRRNSYT